MKYSIFVASLAGTALAAPMSNILNVRQVGDATQAASDAVGGLAGGATEGATDTVGGLTGDATQGATDAVGGLTGAAPKGATDAAGGLTGAAPEGATDAAAGPTDSQPSGDQQAPQQAGPLGAGLLGGALLPGLLRASAPLAPEDIAMLKTRAQMEKRQTGLPLPPGAEVLSDGDVAGTSDPLSPEDIAKLKNGAQTQKRQLDSVTGLATSLLGGLLPGILKRGESLSEAEIAKIISGGSVMHKRDEPLSPEDIAMIGRNGQ